MKPPKIRVALVLYTLEVGGLEKVVLSVLRNLDRERFDPYLICLHTIGDLQSDVPLPADRCLLLRREDGRRLPGVPLDVGAVLKIRSFLRTNRIDVVHLHNCAPLIYGGIAAHLCRPRPSVVYSEHNQIYSAPAGRKRRFPYYVKMADAIVTVSDDLRRTLAGMGITNNVEVIYNGIDPERFRVADGQGLRRELGVAPDEYLIGTAVVLTPQKGIEFLLRAIPAVLREIPRAKFMIAGDGYKKAELQAAANALGVGDRLAFLGYRSDVPRFLNAMDLYVLPSLWEGLPLALIEALACGKPAVVSDVGGNGEIVEDGVNGRLVPPGDPEALARAIIETARDPRFAPADVRDRNRRKFESLFSVEAMVQAHEERYVRAAASASFAVAHSRPSEAEQAG